MGEGVTIRPDVPALLRENTKLLYWVARMMLRSIRRRSDEDINEFASELAVRALSVADQYDPERGSFSLWLVWQGRAVRSRMLSKNRLTWKPQATGGTEITAVEMAAAQYDHTEQVEKAECREILLRAFHESLNDLPGPMRSVARSALVRGTPLRQIAEMRGVHHNAVQETMRRAKTRLRKSMAKKVSGI
jgi:RNA polymerase sigma factor (sigma-70 family)